MRCGAIRSVTRHTETAAQGEVMLFRVATSARGGAPRRTPGGTTHTGRLAPPGTGRRPRRWGGAAVPASGARARGGGARFGGLGGGAPQEEPALRAGDLAGWVQGGARPPLQGWRPRSRARADRQTDDRVGAGPPRHNIVAAARAGREGRVGRRPRGPGSACALVARLAARGCPCTLAARSRGLRAALQREGAAGRAGRRPRRAQAAPARRAAGGGAEKKRGRGRARAGRPGTRRAGRACGGMCGYGRDGAGAGAGEPAGSGRLFPAAA
jgi:hypothetical protein